MRMNFGKHKPGVRDERHRRMERINKIPDTRRKKRETIKEWEEE